MKKIVTVIKAFTLNHNVFVYDENEVIIKKEKPAAAFLFLYLEFPPNRTVLCL